MADVFISYSREDRAAAEWLAETIRTAGHSVWWDYELTPHQVFRDVIEAELNASAAVVVIWSMAARQSIWVKAEADRALYKNKLINTVNFDVDPRELPLPFNQVHAVTISESLAILASVADLKSMHQPQGVEPRRAPELEAIRFVVDAMETALISATPLLQLAEAEQWEGDASYSPRLMRATELVEEPLRLFREGLPFDRITSYRGRALIAQLDSGTDYAYKQIRKELNWLRAYGDRKGVILGARDDIPNAARDLIEEVQLPPEFRLRT